MFESFLKNKKVRKSEPDVSLAKSLTLMSRSQIKFISTIIITEQNASPVLVNYYEALREICEAICAKSGFKVYSHEAFTFYLKEELKEERIAETFDRLRKLRNGVNYYGEYVSKEETEAAAKQVKMLIEELQHKYLSDLFTEQ